MQSFTRLFPSPLSAGFRSGASLALIALLASPIALSPRLALAEDKPAIDKAASEKEAITVPAIEIEGRSTPQGLTLPGYSRIPADRPHAAPSHDAATLLRSVTGVSASRFGGHGSEPVIRGQQQNQLNFESDGAMIFGGCMNRMDPPSSFAMADSYDEIEVVRGYQSVLNGPGATGGVIRFERKNPELTDDKPYEGRVYSGYDSNGDQRNFGGDVAAGTKDAWARAYGSFKASNDYTDGNESTVRSSFDEYNAGMTLGWTPKKGQEVTASYERAGVYDALFAGAGMDSPKSVSDNIRLSGKTPVNAGPLKSVEGSAFATMVDHEMDNYSLRANTGTHRTVDSGSDTFGGRIQANFDFAGAALSTVVDVQHSERDATRYQGTSPDTTTSTQSMSWPDVHVTDIGFGVEGTIPVADGTRVKAGLRYDYVQAGFGREHEKTQISTARSANDLYERYYGVTASSKDEHNFGAVLSVEQDVGDGDTLSATLSRAVRTADATERGMAADGLMMTSMTWVGNPDIKPEAHHQFDLGANFEGEDWAVSGGAWANYVKDYIFRDRARGQNGLLREDGATIYRNIDAFLAGAELDGRFQASPSLLLSAGAAWTWGTNLDQGQALPQIPPIEGRVSAEWQDQDDWSLGGRVRFATKQNRIDNDTNDGSGRDAQATPGHAVLDLFGSVAMLDPLRVDFGITNVLDREYASHLNRANSVDADEVQVNEPGRSFYVRTAVDF